MPGASCSTTTTRCRVGSRAICYAKRTLEILDRLGCGEPIVDKGVGWNVGKVFSRRRARLPVRPAARDRAIAGRRSSTCSSTTSSSFWSSARARCRRSSCAGRTRSSASRRDADGVDADRRHAGRRLRARRATGWSSCDGARSPVRQHARPRVRRAGVPRPLPDRRHPHDSPIFPPSAGSGSIRRSIPNQSVLLHRQADDVWRVDFQLGWDADPESREAARAHPAAAARDARARRATSRSSGRASTRSSAGACSGSATAACCSPATPRISCRPFGARGANSGVQDADNLALEARARAARPRARRAARHLRRRARRGGRREHPQLDALDRLHHAEERRVAHVPRRGAGARASDIRSRARSSTAAACRCRRCSRDSPLNTPDDDATSRRPARWCRARRPPTRRSTARAARGCSHHLGGGFTLLAFGGAGRRGGRSRALARGADPVPRRAGRRAQRRRRDGDRRPRRARRGALRCARRAPCYLLRPDQHVCARWRAFDRDARCARAHARARPAQRLT